MSSLLPYRSDTEVTMPSAVSSYPNGRIPAELLQPCGLRKLRMVEPAAGAMRAMVTAASGDGVKLSATGTWRPFDEQKSLFLQRYVDHDTGGESKTWEGRTYWKLPDVASAATPGKSNHGLGLAADLSDSPTVPLGAGSLKWLSEHGPSFGFWNTVRSEVWHWTYCLGDDVPSTVRAAGGVEPSGSSSGAAVTVAPAASTTWNSIPFSGEIREGADGDAVRAVQAKLVTHGFDIEVDGDFGSQTLGAVTAFQQSHGLTVDGRVGPRTWAALGLPGS